MGAFFVGVCVGRVANVVGYEDNGVEKTVVVTQTSVLCTRMVSGASADPGEANIV